MFKHYIKFRFWINHFTKSDYKFADKFPKNPFSEEIKPQQGQKRMDLTTWTRKERWE